MGISQFPGRLCSKDFRRFRLHQFQAGFPQGQQVGGLPRYQQQEIQPQTIRFPGSQLSISTQGFPAQCLQPRQVGAQEYQGSPIMQNNQWAHPPQPWGTLQDSFAFQGVAQASAKETSQVNLGAQPGTPQFDGMPSVGYENPQVMTLLDLDPIPITQVARGSGMEPAPCQSVNLLDIFDPVTSKASPFLAVPKSVGDQATSIGDRTPRTPKIGTSLGSSYLWGYPCAGRTATYNPT